MISSNSLQEQSCTHGSSYRFLSIGICSYTLGKPILVSQGKYLLGTYLPTAECKHESKNDLNIN